MSYLLLVWCWLQLPTFRYHDPRIALLGSVSEGSCVDLALSSAVGSSSDSAPFSAGWNVGIHFLGRTVGVCLHLMDRL